MTKQTLDLSASDQPVRIERVGGSLKVEAWEKQELEWTGEFVEVVHGTAGLQISCAGDLGLKVPREAALRIEFIGHDLEMQELSGPIDISFVGSDLRLRNLSGQVTFHGFVGGSTTLENVSRVASASGGPGPFGVGGEAVWQKIGKAMGRSDEQRRKIEKKIWRAERKLNRVRVGIDREGARWTWSAGPHPAPGAEARPGASDEERATILRMLQEKKISAEEADRLLGALEGEGS